MNSTFKEWPQANGMSNGPSPRLRAAGRPQGFNIIFIHIQNISKSTSFKIQHPETESLIIFLIPKMFISGVGP